MSEDKIKLLINIAQMYYEQKMTQDEISQQLGIYRTSISRYLKMAEQEGIVNFSINYHLCETFLLEKKLKQLFNLEHIIVINEDKEDDTEKRLNQMGKSMVAYLKTIIQEGDIIGLSWGSSLAAFIEQFDDNVKADILCLPMVGGPAGKLDSRYHVNTLVYKLASKMKGKSLLMDFPAILEEQFLHDAIMKSQHYQQIAQYWNKLSIAIFGIGSFQIADTSIWHEFYGKNDNVQSITENVIAGDICSRFFNINGELIQTTISDRIINISLNNLKKAKYRIGLAQSAEKVEAIIGAINGGYLNVLVTTKHTAQLILNHKLHPK